MLAQATLGGLICQLILYKATEVIIPSSEVAVTIIESTKVIKTTLRVEVHARC